MTATGLEENGRVGSLRPSLQWKFTQSVSAYSFQFICRIFALECSRQISVCLVFHACILRSFIL